MKDMYAVGNDIMYVEKNNLGYVLFSKTETSKSFCGDKELDTFLGRAGALFIGVER